MVNLNWKVICVYEHRFDQNSFKHSNMRVYIWVRSKIKQKWSLPYGLIIQRFQYFCFVSCWWHFYWFKNLRHLGPIWLFDVMQLNKSHNDDQILCEYFSSSQILANTLHHKYKSRLTSSNPSWTKNILLIFWDNL